MKRFLVFLLVISVMLLPGCGSSKSQDTRTVLTLVGGGHGLLCLQLPYEEQKKL